jgi:hypothetical protein
MLVWQTGRGRRAQRRMIAWTRYQARCDKLADRQPSSARIGNPVRSTPGYFRAEGWQTDRGALRHGA